MLWHQTSYKPLPEPKIQNQPTYLTTPHGITRLDRVNLLHHTDEFIHYGLGKWTSNCTNILFNSILWMKFHALAKVQLDQKSSTQKYWNADES